MRARTRSKCAQCPWSIKKGQWIYLYVAGKTKAWVHGPCYFKLINGTEEPKFVVDVDAVIERLAEAPVASQAELPVGVVSPEGFKGVLSK